MNEDVADGLFQTIDEYEKCCFVFFTFNYDSICGGCLVAENQFYLHRLFFEFYFEYDEIACTT